jgi:hypothetical protein
VAIKRTVVKASPTTDIMASPAASPDLARAANDTQAGVGRFRTVCGAAIAAAAIPYLWVLWDLWTGTINPLRENRLVDIPIYDVQARAIMHGHLSLPNGSISYEAFIHDGHQYTYFGIFPSLLRIPFFLFTHSLDGRFTALSILGAWVVTAVFSCLLLWRLRVLLRGDAPLGWSEVASYGVFLAAILVGSVLVYLASVPNANSEDEVWSVALACASFFALVGVVERPSWGRATTCGILVLLTNLNRGTTGYAAVLATLLIALWFALGRAGPERRRWALPMALAALVPLAIGCAIDLAKFGMVFGVPFSDYLLYKEVGLVKLNGGQYFGLRYLPSTLQAYVDPANFRVSSVFPYITLPDVPRSPIAHTALFLRTPTTNVPLSMPLLFISGVWGVITAFAPGRSREFRALRILLVTSAATVGALMIYGAIDERFVADFMPLLVLASMIGMVDIWRRFDGRSRATGTWVSAIIGVLALFGICSNMGYAVTPEDNWTQTQLSNFINVQRTISDVTGHPLEHDVVGEPQTHCGNREKYLVGDCDFPMQAPMGTLFIRGRCAELYIARQAVPAGVYYPDMVWLLVEQAPHTPICHALISRD